MGSVILAKSEFFGSISEIRRDVFGSRKKKQGFFWVAKNGLRDFLGYAKKSSDFFGSTNSEVVIFLGLKYEPLLDPPPPPPPLLKFVSEWPLGLM